MIPKSFIHYVSRKHCNGTPRLLSWHKWQEGSAKIWWRRYFEPRLKELNIQADL